MSYRSVNLARRPFVNTRPVKRTTLALWFLGGCLLIVNGVLYSRSLVGLEDGKAHWEAMTQEIEVEEEGLEKAKAALQRLDLRDQNTQAEFLRARFERRRFPWSRLFSQIAEVLPREVRLFRISPQGLSRTQKRGTRDLKANSAPASVLGKSRIGVSAVARTDDALVELLDSLFASPVFSDPVLPGERRQDDNSIEFRLSMTYYPYGDESSQDGVVGQAEAEWVGGPNDPNLETVVDLEVGARSSEGEATVGPSNAGRESSSSARDGRDSMGAATITTPGRVPGAERIAGRGTRNEARSDSDTDRRRSAPDRSRSATAEAVPNRVGQPQPLAPTASSPGSLK